MQEKVSVSIDKEIIRNIDRLIDNVYIKNRSQAFEFALRKFFVNEPVKDALILLGGGKLNFLNKKVGKYSILEHAIENFKSYGIKNIYIAAGQNNSKVFELIGNGTKYGVNIIFLEEKAPLGTAGAIKLAKDRINSTFFVACGDVYFKFDLLDMIRFHKERSKIATISLVSVGKGDYDYVEVSGDRMKSFSYLSRSKSLLTNAGIYLFEPSIFDYLPDKGSFETDVIPRLITENKIFAYNFSGEWEHFK